MPRRGIGCPPAFLRVFVGVLLTFGLADVVWPAVSSSLGPYLPQTPLFDLTRQSDMVVLVTAMGDDVVRVDEVLGQKSTLKTLTVANFDRLRRGLYLPSPAFSPQDQSARQAILFLRQYGKRWWIQEMIPRARAANGCLWVRNNQVFWYSRNPWGNGPRLVERPLVVPIRKSSSAKNATLPELLAAVRLWQSDLARLRQIDKISSPVVQLRALRAFIVPSRQTSHSLECLALAKGVYREVYQQVDAIRDGKKPEPAANSAWLAIRSGPPASVVQAVARTKSEKGSERLVALQELSFAAAPEVLPAALRGLGDTSMTVRLAAARVLGDYADASCSRTLLAYYRSTRNRTDPLRQHLLRAMATSEEPNAVAELILALQEPDEPMRDDIVQMLFWASGYRPDPKESRATASYLSAAWWGRWYEKRFNRKVDLKPWDFARLQSWINRRAGMSIVLPASEWSQIPTQTIQEILTRCADLQFPSRGRWCELLLQAWNAGVLTAQHQKEFFSTFGRATIEGRKVYPLGSRASLRVVSAWPSSVAVPQTLRFISKSQIYVDGSPVGRSYPMTYPIIYVGQLSPGDYGPGPHRVRISTEYTVGAGKVGSTSHSVEIPEQQFDVVFPNQDYGLEARSDPQLDAQVQRAFRFVSLPDAPANATSLQTAAIGSRRGRFPRRFPRASGGYYDILGHNRWEVTEKLPVDLAFDVEYEFPDAGILVSGGSLYVPQETTDTADLNPLAYRTKGLEKTGAFRFRVHLTPSRDVALSHPESRAFWDGFILTSPEMTFVVVETPPAKKP